jgi:hypothetical protein
VHLLLVGRRHERVHASAAKPARGAHAHAKSVRRVLCAGGRAEQGRKRVSCHLTFDHVLNHRVVVYQLCEVQLVATHCT